MSLNLRLFAAFAVFLIPFSSFADTDPAKYPLGMSPKSLHDKLVLDQFVFESFTSKKIVAIKRVVVAPNQGEEFPNVVESTKITASMCSGKLFKLIMSSLYGGDRKPLLLGRKSFYKYLKDNGAVNDDINIHKAPDNPRVVLKYSIDRNNQASKDVRGTEIVKVALGESKNVTDKLKMPLLEMTYMLENKWFCPS
jgi:hypothetical protein